MSTFCAKNRRTTATSGSFRYDKLTTWKWNKWRILGVPTDRGYASHLKPLIFYDWRQSWTWRLLYNKGPEGYPRSLSTVSRGIFGEAYNHGVFVIPPTGWWWQATIKYRLHYRGIIKAGGIKKELKWGDFR